MGQSALFPYGISAGFDEFIPVYGMAGRGDIGSERWVMVAILKLSSYTCFFEVLLYELYLSLTIWVVAFPSWGAER